MSIRLENYQSNFDRGAGRLKEGLWVITKIVFFQLPVPMPSALRRNLLRVFGAKIGAGVIIRHGVDITFPWRLTIGDFSWIGEDVKLLNLTNISIGSDCCISQRAFLCTGSHVFLSEKFDLVVKPVVIKNSSWIAAQAFISPGVTVGENALIAAASVVTKNVPGFHMLAGNPARTIRELPELHPNSSEM